MQRPAASWGYILAWLVLVAAGFAGAVLLIAADFTTLRGVRVIEVDLHKVSAGDHHGYALVVVGIAALGFSWRAVGRRGLGAMGGVAAGGLIALLVAIVVDLPRLGSPAPVDQYYALARAWTGSAMTLELVGSALLLVSGCAQMALYMRRPRWQPARPSPALALGCAPAE